MKNDYNKNIKRTISIALVAASLVIVSAILISLIFEFDTIQNLILGWILTGLYGTFAIILVGDLEVVEIEKIIPIHVPVENRIIEFIEKPVFRDLPIQIPIENKVIEIIEKPVIREVFIERENKTEKKKLNIPPYNFLGSSETKRFHKRNCRFSKLIKKKYKVHNNSKAYFKNKRYKACKVCIKN